jgi:hypothetical protein
LTRQSRILGNIQNIVSLRGYYSPVDRRNNVIVATTDGKVHYLFWEPHSSAKITELPVTFGSDAIISVSGHYSADDQRHMAIVGTRNGKIHEIFSHDPQNIEGHNDLPGINFSEIVAVSGHFSVDDPFFQGHGVIVGTKKPILHEIFWRSGQVGIDGHNDLPVNITRSITSVSSHYSTNDQRTNVIVGKREDAGPAIDWIFWKSSTVGVESHFRVPIFIPSFFVPFVSSYYSADDQRHHIIYFNDRGSEPVTEVFTKPGEQVVEGEHHLTTTLDPDDIVSVSGHYNVFEQLNNLIVGKENGEILHIFWKSGEF